MLLVNDIQVGSPDERGLIVQQMFARVSNRYCVYKAANDNRIMIQFADDEAVGDEQRLRLTELEPERSTINAEFDGWQSAIWKKLPFVGSRVRYTQMAAGFEQRMAQGVVSALNGNPALGKSQLAGVLADLRAERLSIGRLEYLLASIAAGVLLVALAAWLGPKFAECTVQDVQAVAEASDKAAATPTFGCFVDGGGLFLAVGMATLGALFSIAMAIRDRNIQTDKSRRSNLMDASLRIVVAAVASIVLFALLFSGYVTLQFGETDVTGDMSVTAWPAMVVAFLAGFFERLVSNFLAATPATLAMAGAAGAAPASSLQTAPSTSPTGNGGTVGATAAATAVTETSSDPSASPDSATDAAEAEEEVGLTTGPGEGATAAETTTDEELPAAQGGVENETR